MSIPSLRQDENTGSGGVAGVEAKAKRVGCCLEERCLAARLNHAATKSRPLNLNGGTQIAESKEKGTAEAIR